MPPPPHATAILAELGSPESLGDDLSRLVDDLSAEHQRLLEAVTDHRESMRRADTKAMAGDLARQQSALGRIAELEQTRRKIVNTAAETAPFTGPGPLTLTALAQLQPEPLRSSLVQRTGVLKGLIAKAHAEQKVLRTIAESLAGHVEGLVRQVSKKLSHAGTYGRRGFDQSAPAVVSSLDLKS